MNCLQIKVKKLLVLILISCCIACQNQRIVELPQIKNAAISEVLDVSPVYMFYDTTAQDSVIFNRKNMISTTNWLVNIDRRLTLKQIFPHLQYLQEKRQKAGMHKNESAKNYFTCNDLSIANIGFIEFTRANYLASLNTNIGTKQNHIYLFLNKNNSIEIKSSTDHLSEISTSKFIETIEDYLKKNDSINEIFLVFNEELTFQKYIDYKVLLSEINVERNTISSNEYILNLNSLN